jgi:aspartate beta-hydroxylase
MTTEPAPAATDVAALRSQAISALQQGNAALAEQCFARVLEKIPDDVEALQFTAARHLSRGNAAQAVAVLQMAQRSRPDVPQTLQQLGMAQLMAGDRQGAAHSFERCLQLAPDLFVVRLHLGNVLEQLGETQRALLAYSGAVRGAQVQGRWMNDASTPPGLRPAVQHAIRFISAGCHQTFDAVLEPLRQRYGAAELKRVEHCLAIYLGQRPSPRPDARQQPKFLYFPDIPSQTYYPKERFAWQAELEAATETIREELLTVLAENQPLLPFLGEHSPEALGTYLGPTGERPAQWDGYFFYRHGQRFDENAARCPRTASLLDSFPLVRIRDHAPEILFSVLRPGTHILPHRGVTNTRLVTHLPLIVPPDCAIKVGGEIHAWQEGQCVTFDDTFEHDAWNKSEQTRVIVLMDSWNPDLTDIERAAVVDLVEAIGDFNQASGVATPMA